MTTGALAIWGGNKIISANGGRFADIIGLVLNLIGYLSTGSGIYEIFKEPKDKVIELERYGVPPEIREDIIKGVKDDNK